MAIIGGELAYRFLRWYAPRGASDGMDGSAYDSQSKLRVLLGDTLVESLRDKVVIDFGCGDGEQAIEMAAAGASRVLGVDLQVQRFPAAREAAERAGVADRVRFSSEADERADVIVSIDSFEHFEDPARILTIMSSLLTPNGRVVVSFGPTWYHPLGGHLFSVFPWAHLVFSESSLLRWRSDFKSDGATRFHEVAGGLNQMTIKRFEQLVESSPLRMQSFEVVPIRRLAKMAKPITREFTTAIVRCCLELR